MTWSTNPGSRAKLTTGQRKLGEIAKIYQGGKSGLTKKDYVKSGFPAFSATGQDGFTKKAFDSGFAVILSSIGARCGKCFYAEGKWTALANTQVVKLDNSTTAKFLYYYLNDENKWPRYGSAQPFIAPSTVKRLKVPFPSLSIQRKIVERLDAIKKAQELNDKQIELAEELFQNLLHRELYPKGKNWEMEKIGELCNIYQPKTITSAEILEEGPYKVYGANGVIGYYNKYNHEDPEVLVTCRGATCGTINLSEPKCWITGNAMVVHPKIPNLSKIFLYFVLKKTNLSSTITGAAQPQITRASLSPFEIPLPLVETQRKIVEKLSVVQGYKKKLIEQKQKLQELFESVLNKSFQYS